MRGGAYGVIITYQGYDITRMVNVRTCIVRDTAGERSDGLELEFENPAGWYSWNPEEDDEIVVSHGGYDSGIMYVNYIEPQDGKFRIYASSLPVKARKKEYRSYYRKTLEDIVRSCAVLSGLNYQLVGVDGKVVVPYIERDYEGCSAFLSRLLMLEGAALKCINGKYVAIGIEYAQALNPQQTLRLVADQRGASYRRTGNTYRSLTVKSPYAVATARDLNAPDTHDDIVTTELPVLETVQATRWARGKLLHHNRMAEQLAITTKFNAGHTAMIRINIDGNTDATGDWIAESVEHDLKNETTSTILRRCVYGIQ